MLKICDHSSKFNFPKHVHEKRDNVNRHEIGSGCGTVDFFEELRREMLMWLTRGCCRSFTLGFSFKNRHRWAVYIACMADISNVDITVVKSIGLNDMIELLLGRIAVDCLQVMCPVS